MECIIKYTPDNLSFLKRKLITREILFTYLNDNNIPVQSPFTKPELIQRILSFWNSSFIGGTLVKRENVKLPIKEELSAQNEPPNVNEMATKFAEWFYTLLNANEPLGTEHFWPDSKLRLNLPQSTIEINDSASDIVEVLFKTKNEHNLYFNPNLTSDGTKGKIDVYGLVLVLSCGTLHVNDEVVGVYEHVFSLARDPLADNNWKIKSMQLNLVSKNNVERQPSLSETELTGNLLALPET